MIYAVRNRITERITDTRQLGKRIRYSAGPITSVFPVRIRAIANYITYIVSRHRFGCSTSIASAASGAAEIGRRPVAVPFHRMRLAVIGKADDLIRRTYTSGIVRHTGVTRGR